MSGTVQAKKHKTEPVAVAEEEMGPKASAKAAGLRYLSDVRAGIGRKRTRTGFRYVGPHGEPVRDKETLARIKSLVIPPAWVDVWISPIANGHLQATGRDAKGRKQSRYHPRWREVRDETKYARMVQFGEALPMIRARVEQDLSLPGLPRLKVLAALVRLMETTFIRVGNEESCANEPLVWTDDDGEPACADTGRYGALQVQGQERCSPRDRLEGPAAGGDRQTLP